MLGLFLVTTAIFLVLAAFLYHTIRRLSRAVNLDEPVILETIGLGDNSQIGLEPSRFTRGPEVRTPALRFDLQVRQFDVSAVGHLLQGDDDFGHRQGVFQERRTRLERADSSSV